LGLAQNINYLVPKDNMTITHVLMDRHATVLLSR